MSAAHKKRKEWRNDLSEIADSLERFARVEIARNEWDKALAIISRNGERLANMFLEIREAKDNPEYK